MPKIGGTHASAIHREEKSAETCIWSASRSRNGTRLVLLALAHSMCGSDDSVEISVEEIANLTHLTSRTIWKCLGELEDLKEIRVAKGGGSGCRNRYTLLLKDSADLNESESGGTVTRGKKFTEAPQETVKSSAETLKPSPSKGEIYTDTRGSVNTPYGSINTQEKQASLPRRSASPSALSAGPVPVPEAAGDLVSSLTNAGMLVGWGLSAQEWEEVTALSARWGVAALVEFVSRRWSAARPPKTARYLLRIWADLPSCGPSGPAPTSPGAVPLRSAASGWAPYRNPVATAYQNGF